MMAAMPTLIRFLALGYLPHLSLQKRIRNRGTSRLEYLDVGSVRDARSQVRQDGGDKQYDWKGVVGHVHIDFPARIDKRTQRQVEAQKHKIEGAFLALPGKTHSSACKLSVHKEASTQLTQPVSKAKATMVGQVKGLLMMLCMAIDEHVSAGHMSSLERVTLGRAHKLCRDLRLTTAEGAHEALAADSRGENEPTNDAESMHLISDSQKDEILKILKPNGPTAERIDRLTDKLSMSTRVYMCLVNHEATEYYSDSDLSNHTGAWGTVKGFAKTMARGFWKTPLDRLGKKLSRNERDSSSRAGLYTKLVGRIVDTKRLASLDCEAALSDQELLMLKGTPDSRLGSIDLMSLSTKTVTDSGEVHRSRKVAVTSSSESELVLEMTDDLMELSDSSPRTVMKITAPGEDDIEYSQSEFATLRTEIEKHIELCKVEKVGVFNVAMKSRMKNKFTWSENNPWKVVFFSQLATQLFTKDAQPREGYDLFGDPQEIEQPCKWKARALEEGKYQPVSQTLLWLKDVGEVVTAGENMTFMKYRNSDEGAFLWMDDKLKIVMPEWARGQKGIFNCKALGCDGRSFPDYSKNFADDVRGLINSADSSMVLETLQKFGWEMDPIVNWHVKGWRKTVDSRYNHDTGDVEITGNISRMLVREHQRGEPLQLSSALVSAIYPFDDMTASVGFLKLGSLLSTESSSLWSVYDYIEGYHDHCFVWDGSSVGDGNDIENYADANGGSGWFVDVPFASTIHFCTNSFDGKYNLKSRKIVQAGGTVNRGRIIEELTAFYSRGRQNGTAVVNKEVKPCRSTTDALFSTCFGPSDCKENPDSPCPNGYACDCDVSARGTAMNVGMALSVIAEGTFYMDWSISLFGPICVTGVTAIAMPFLIPACPFIAGALGYIQAPFGTNTPIVIAGISIVMGMSSCGCVKMECGSGKMIPTGNSNRVCALRHPNNMENLNPVAFVPPAGLKCVQGTTMGMFDKCEYKKCNGDENLARKVQWEQRTTSYRRVTEIFNCHSPENPMSDKELASRFNEGEFIAARPDDKEIREGLVPRPTEDVKLSDLISPKFWARIGGELGTEIRKCFWSTKTRRNLEVYHHGWVGKLVKFPFKLLMSPLCLAKVALTSSLSLAFFLLDYVMGAAIQMLLSTIRLLEKVHVNLIRAGRWWQYCDASGNKLEEPTAVELGQCPYHANSHTECGVFNVTSDSCKALGCCWDETSPDHKCYPRGPVADGSLEDSEDLHDVEEIERLMNTTNGMQVAEMFDQIEAKVTKELSDLKKRETLLVPEIEAHEGLFNDPKFEMDELGNYPHWYDGSSTTTTTARGEQEAD